MDVLQITGSKQNRVIENTEVSPSTENEWAELMKQAQDSSADEEAVYEGVQIEQISHDASDLDSVEVGELEADTDTLAPPMTRQVVSIQEHALNSDWNDGGLTQKLGASDATLGEIGVDSATSKASISENSQLGSVQHSIPQIVDESLHAPQAQSMIDKNVVQIAHAGPNGSADPGVGLEAQVAGQYSEQKLKADAVEALVNAGEADEAEGKTLEIPRTNLLPARGDVAPQLTAQIQSQLTAVGDANQFLSEGNTKLGDQIAGPSLSGPAAAASTAVPTAPMSSIPIARDPPVIAQVMQAVGLKEHDTIELRLDPAELGKVRITMAARDGVMVATIVAERPETLELLRRNADSLGTGFSEQGFTDTQLDFQHSDADERPDDRSQDTGPGESLDVRATNTLHVVQHQPADGLDIRI